MANNSFIGAGAKLQVTIASVLTDVVGITSIGGPAITFTDIDTTLLTSTNVFKEFLAGFGDGGTVTLEANMDATEFNTLYGLIRVVQVWRIIFSQSSKWDFSGYISAIGTENPLDDKVTMPFSIKITGKPTFTP